jgi:hypothetical protein
MGARVLRRMALGAALLLAAGFLTLLTSSIRRQGPEQAIYNHECGDAAGALLRAAPRGGLPRPVLVRHPGVSVEHQLALGEDRIRPTPLLLDIAFFTALLTAVAWAWRRLRAA